MLQRVAARTPHLWVRLALALGVVAVGGGLLLRTPLGTALWEVLRHPSVERVERLLPATPGWLPLLIMGLMVLHTLVPVPAELLAFAAGMLLGPAWGLIAVWAGAMLGAYLGFGLGRVLGRPILEWLVAMDRLERVQRRLYIEDALLLLTVRLVPLFSFNLLNYALGLTTLSWWRFTWTTGVGIVPMTALMVLLGDQLTNWKLLTVITLVGLLLCVGSWAFLHRRRRCHACGEGERTTFVEEEGYGRPRAGRTRSTLPDGGSDPDAY